MAKTEFVELAQKLMAKKVILEPSQDPKRLAEDMLAEHLQAAYELGWEATLASRAPSDQRVHTGEVIDCPARSVVDETCICKSGWGHRSFVVPSEAAAQPTDLRDKYWHYVAAQIFFHVLLHGGEGNPFTTIAHNWFADLAAPKLKAILDARDFAMAETKHKLLRQREE